MSQYIPLHEVIRPRGDRDAGGADGETLHKVADILERQENPILVDKDSNHHNLAQQLSEIPGSYDFGILRDAAVKILKQANERSSQTLGDLLSQQN